MDFVVILFLPKMLIYEFPLLKLELQTETFFKARVLGLFEVPPDLGIMGY